MIIPNRWENKIDVPNHQPACNCYVIPFPNIKHPRFSGPNVRVMCNAPQGPRVSVDVFAFEGCQLRFFFPQNA